MTRTLNARLQALLLRASGRQDLVLVVLLVTMIAMMILPLPTFLVDALLAANMGLTVLLLMVGIYLRSPLDFSTLPSVILIGTVFRLALSITTTRLILLQADAGHVVQTFGEFVVGGNIIVGLVIFLIITVVQFVVITKGSERVAEVAARFTLDALPGKQMSIDSDLRNGDIDKDEARRRRRTLEKESQLYGALDGAMKFVKGDAIAGIVIIFVNLLGGVCVGMLQHGMALGEAMHVYSLLTVGDGLVAQIPALFMSITAGTIITRVTSDDSESGNLGSDITGQLAADSRSLLLAGVVLAGLGFIPGFPTPIFLLLAALFGGVGLVMRLRERERKTAAAAKTDDDARETAQAAAHGAGPAARDEPVPIAAPVTVALAANLSAAIEPARFHELARRARTELQGELGVPFPAVRLAAAPELDDDRFRIDLDDVPVAEGRVPVGRLLLTDDPEHLTLADIPAERGAPLLGVEESVWIDDAHLPALVRAGIGHADAAEVLTLRLKATLARYAAHFVGIQETQGLLTGMEGSHGDLVREAQRAVPLQKMADVLRRLLEEGVPARNLRLVLEALVEWGPKEQDVVLLAEYVRTALKRQICHKYADGRKVIAAHLFERQAEEAIRAAVRQTAVGGFLALPDDVAARLVVALREQLGRPKPEGAPVSVVMTSLDIRRFVRNLLVKNGLTVPVLSYQDLAPEFTVQPIGTLKLAVAGRRSEAVRVAAERRPPTPAGAVG